jgi:hypothetical protein
MRTFVCQPALVHSSRAWSGRGVGTSPDALHTECWLFFRTSQPLAVGPLPAGKRAIACVVTGRLEHSPADGTGARTTTALGASGSRLDGTDAGLPARSTRRGAGGVDGQADRVAAAAAPHWRAPALPVAGAAGAGVTVQGMPAAAEGPIDRLVGGQHAAAFITLQHALRIPAVPRECQLLAAIHNAVRLASWTFAQVRFRCPESRSLPWLAA